MRKFYSIKKAGVVAIAIVFGLASVGTSVAATTDIASSSQQQETKTVRVSVKDAQGQPLIGAIVNIKGTNKAAATDGDGVASINVPSGSVLTVSFMGYKAYELPVGQADAYTINMVEDAINLDQVVVVGYGTQKKANLTGAVSQVDMEKVLGDRPVTTVGAALQGTIPGLVITGGAVPGTAATFNIRGYTSINGGSPLILVDNVPADINLINPEDIQSVTVLKDAASTAIYGARAAFGVILVTTKKANKSTKLSINYNDNFAFTKSYNNPVQAPIRDFLNTMVDYDIDGKWHAGQDLKQWIGYLDQFETGTLMANNPDAYYKDGRFVPNGEKIYYHLMDTNPTESLFDPYGFQQTHNVSATGGSEHITYRMSLGYMDSDGPLASNKDRYSRINVSSYVSADITKWLSTALDIRYAKDDRSEARATYTSWFTNFQPIGKIPKSTDLTGPEYWMESPYASIMAQEPTKYSNENPRIYSRTSIRPVKGLEGIFEYTYDQTNWDKKQYDNPYEMINMAQGDVGRQQNLFYRNDKGLSRYNALNAFLTYNVSTRNEKHNFTVMAGFSQETEYTETLWAKRLDMINPDMPSISGSTGTTEAGDAFSEYAIRGGFFRFNYNFEDKYLVEVNGRYDGSSRFPSENRYGFFPSASLGWQLAKEKFMDWSDSWLDEFKIRGSWGQVGNQNIGNYLYTPFMNSGLAGWITPDMTRPTTLSPPALVRSNFTWEVVETLDFAVDMAMFNNRLTGTVEWYQRDTKGMLAPGMELPSVVGANAPEQNVADLRTQGWEVAFNWRDKIGDWNYSVGFNFFDSQTEITKYNNENGVLGANNDNLYVGRKIGEIWGYTTDGFYTIDDFQDGWQNGAWKLKEGVTSILDNNKVRPGDLKFKNFRDDNNSTNAISAGDGTLQNSGDMQVIGNNASRFQYGINASVGWKGLALSIMFVGTGKRDAWIGGDLMWPINQTTFGTVYADQLDYWKPTNWNTRYGDVDYTAQNPDARLPRIYDENKNAGSNNRVQTKYLQDASYLRLKNVTLSYSVPREAMQKIGMVGAKVFFSGENLVTWSKLPKGVDPVRLTWAYPFYSSYSFGISLTL